MNLNVTIDDKMVAGKVGNLLQAVLKIPLKELEHAVQVGHESPEHDFERPPEFFLNQGVTRQTLRMFWHFRCNLEAATREASR